MSSVTDKNSSGGGDPTSGAGVGASTASSLSREEVVTREEWDGLPIALPLRVLFLVDFMSRIIICGFLMPLMWPLHMFMKSFNQSTKYQSFAFSPTETFNIIIGKGICWGLGVRVARVGLENFIDDRGTKLHVRYDRNHNHNHRNVYRVPRAYQIHINAYI